MLGLFKFFQFLCVYKCTRDIYCNKAALFTGFLVSDWFPGWPQHQHYNKQPNDDGLSEQDCVEVRRTYTLPSTSVSLAPGFMWNDRDCATHNYFICEKLQNDGKYKAYNESNQSNNYCNKRL